MTPKPGTYRDLFLKALAVYEYSRKLTDEELATIDFYRTCLNDHRYKFGFVTPFKRLTNA